MKFCITALAGLCLLLPQAHAQDDAAKHAKVEELFTVMRLDHTLDRLMSAIRSQASTIAQSAPGYDQMTPEQKRISEEFQNKIMTLATDSVGWKALEPEMVNLYASTYSEQEIEGLIAFYKSPVGQSFLDKTPELSEKSLQLTQERMVALRPKLQELMEEYRKQLSATSSTAPAQSPAASPAAKPGAVTPK